MASVPSREERKQMRLRGAGNHKVKDVNFGFSFGSPPPLSPVSAPRSPVLQKGPTTPQSRHSTTSNKQLSIPSRASSRRSAGSVSTPKPQGVAIYDIPPDDDGPRERSAKRRRTSRSAESSASERSPTGQHSNGTRPSLLESLRRSKEVSRSSPVRQTASPVEETVPLQDSQPPIKATDPVYVSPKNPGNDDQQQVLPQQHTTITLHNPKQKRRKRKSVVQHPKKKRKSLPKQPLVQENRDVDVEGEDEQTQIRDRSLSSNADKGQGELYQPEDATIPNGEFIDAPRDPSSTRIEEEVHETAESIDEGQTIQQDNGIFETIEAVDHVEDSLEEVQDETHVAEDIEEAGAENASDPELRSPESEQQGTQEKDVQEEQTRSTQLDSSNPKPSKPGRKRKNQSVDESTKTKRRAPKQKQKGEGRSTVPVLIHRLANTSALHDLSGEEDSDRSSQASERHLSPSEQTSRRPKIISRSGVNAADVLSQICRETLEKTVSTLESAIEREPNRSRQVEWTRKRKAVEAFGTELEGRLFEMSELLDSNFVLAMRLKKEKKEVLSLRNQLMDLRKEREEIAIHADDVRRRFSADENAKTEHGTVNNALHDLQLAVERSQKTTGRGFDVDSADPFVGLEFLLRTVSQDVCSSSSNFYGGLLNQVKSFNSQLERAAALLDRRDP